MIPKIPEVLKSKALVMNAQGHSQAESAKANGMSSRTLRRAKARQHEFGDIEKGYKGRGRKGMWAPSFKDVRKLEVCHV
jgi:hypothetical protein